jgi:hypothetical protein
MLADYIMRDSLDPWKMVPFGLISGAFLFTVFDLDNYTLGAYPNGEQALFYSTGITGQLFTILSLYWTIIFFYLFFRIARESPSYLKQKAWLNVFSIILLAGRGILFEPLNQIAPILNVPILVIAVILQVYTFVKYPELAYTLAKKVLSLVVVDTKSGVAVFGYNWVENSNNQENSHVFFSGMVMGVNNILLESIRRGNVDKIMLEHGILLLERIPDSPWTVALSTGKSQVLIRQALHNFALKFKQQFPAISGSVFDMDQYQSANTLIDECFPFGVKFIDN